MVSKLALTLALFCLLYAVIGIQATFIKPNNVPRVGRSSEADGPYTQNEMGYVIKTPNKNIPRMGRRNYDAENRYDIPKLYQVSAESFGPYEGGQLESFYENPFDSKRR